MYLQYCNCLRHVIYKKKIIRNRSFCTNLPYDFSAQQVKQTFFFRVRSLPFALLFSLYDYIRVFDKHTAFQSGTSSLRRNWNFKTKLSRKEFDLETTKSLFDILCANKTTNKGRVKNQNRETTFIPTYIGIFNCNVIFNVIIQVYSTVNIFRLIKFDRKSLHIHIQKLCLKYYKFKIISAHNVCILTLKI